MSISVFGPAAFFTSITYIAPMMVEIAKFDPASVTWLMVVFGLGLCLGNVLGGRYADKALMPLLYVTLAGQAIVLFVFSMTAHSQIMSVACIPAHGRIWLRDRFADSKARNGQSTRSRRSNPRFCSQHWPV